MRRAHGLEKRWIKLILIKKTHALSKVESKSRAFQFKCLSVSHYMNLKKMDQTNFNQKNTSSLKGGE